MRLLLIVCVGMVLVLRSFCKPGLEEGLVIAGEVAESEIVIPTVVFYLLASLLVQWVAHSIGVSGPIEEVMPDRSGEADHGSSGEADRGRFSNDDLAAVCVIHRGRRSFEDNLLDIFRLVEDENDNKHGRYRREDDDIPKLRVVLDSLSKRAQRWLEKNSPDGDLNKLSMEEKVALRVYTMNGFYKPFNRLTREYLANGNFADFPFRAFYDLLHGAIYSNVGHISPTTLYRGARNTPQCNVGDSYQFQQFVSTTLNSTMARMFTLGRGTVFIILGVRKALEISDLAFKYREEEVLIGPDETFKVIKRKKVGSILEITLEPQL